MTRATPEGAISITDMRAEMRGERNGCAAGFAHKSAFA
jgi:hypothetical protein